VLSTGKTLLVLATYLLGFAVLSVLHTALGLERTSSLVWLFGPVPFCLLLYSWLWSKDQPG
jgi:hypothetical protein